MKPTSPCVSLLLSILAPIVAFTTTAAAEPEPTTYVADGVNLKDILNSTRFYDTGKGLYWKQTGQPYNGAQQLYNQYGGFSFMGDLQNRISGTGFGRMSGKSSKIHLNKIVTLSNNDVSLIVIQIIIKTDKE